MKKVFKLVDLDCAHCAQKMEDAISKLDGVHNATVSFMLQKLTLEAEDEQFDQIVEQMRKVCKKIEPDCQIIVR